MGLKEKWVDYEDRFFRVKEAIVRRTNRLIFLTLAFGFSLVIYQIGFPKEQYAVDWVNSVLRQIPKLLMLFFLFKWTLKIILSTKKIIFERKHISDFVIFFVFFVFNIFKNQNAIFASEYFLYLLIASFFFLRFLSVSTEVKNSLLSPSILFTISFSFLIFWGTAMLLIPKATNGNLSLIDSLFTATSAVCVTGLATVDVPTKFTGLGQDILLVLIQIGGLGLMTFTNFFAILFRGGMSLRNHLILSNIIETDEPSSLFSILKKILFFTLLVEFLGAILIFIFTAGTYPGTNYDYWYFSFFHAISAFCNAGFSNMADGLYNVNLRKNYNLQNVISWLIILGGIGFPVVIEIYNAMKYYTKSTLKLFFFGERFSFQAKSLSVHSRLVLSSTFVLLAVGTIAFYFLEKNNTLAEHTSLYGKLSGSFFGSVTPRTAGFNTVNMGNLMQSTILLYLLLMWIGAAPSSTGGGIKVTTFTLAVSNVVALAKGKTRIELFRREISQSSVQRAFVVIFTSFMILGVAIFLMSIFDPQIPLHMVAFECFSAYGTVGLSLNLTPSISDGSKLVLIVCMFLGRVGLFTMLFGIFKKVDCDSYRYPKDSVQVM
ncbi:TrkH family potassium uptake protein [Lacihabitans sp. CS3-21]|uniref:TrkH family potassium uptake protein n=1 Tax=Lacihabitans sp. CS3-21 TaxID=2487332 RepID=UPI0020CEFA2D|nr:potassium transporter TrkG [Lacihabitans sp. CS3-21]MCP9746699.1 ATPase [Lacihabitans sp. CS3-21]